MDSGHRIPFLTDQCVPDSVGSALATASHDVMRLRDCMANDSADQLVAIACIVSQRVLVTHDKDFRQISKRLKITQREYWRLHRISMRCSEVNSASRLKSLLPLIAHEWQTVLGDSQRRLEIEITEVAIRIVR